MTLLPQILRRRDEDGASAVEYGLLVALIAAVIVIAVFAFGSVVQGSFHYTCSKLTSPGPIQGTCSE